MGDELGCTATGFQHKDQSITLQMLIQQLDVIDIDSFERALIRTFNDIGVDTNEADAVINNLVSSLTVSRSNLHSNCKSTISSASTTTALYKVQSAESRATNIKGVAAFASAVVAAVMML